MNIKHVELGLDRKDIVICALLLSVLVLFAYVTDTPTVACADCDAHVKFVFSPDAQDDVISFIDSSQKTIDIEMYVFTSEDIIVKLSDAMKRGVKVRVILEPRIDDARQKKTFALLQELGANVRWASMSYKLTHSKFVIVDGKKALVGSINFSKSALNDNRETAVEVESEKVSELVSVFEVDWKMGSGTIN